MLDLVKRLVFGSFFIAMGVGHMACTPSNGGTLATQTKMTMGLSADYPPFEFKKNGEVVGFDVDVARAIAREMDVSLTIEDMDFSALIPSLQSGRIDFVMAGMTVTEERKKNVDFSSVYFTATFSIIVDQGSSFQGEQDFIGKKVGAQLGSTMEKFAKEKAKLYPNMQVVALAKNPVLIQELKSGRLDGVISEEVQASAFVQANPTLKQIRLQSTADGYAVAFAKGKNHSEAFQKRFNDALERVKASGELKKLKQQWLGN